MTTKHTGAHQVLTEKPTAEPRTVPCGVCGGQMDPLYPCHCTVHQCEMPDGLCDECMNDEDERDASR